VGKVDPGGDNNGTKRDLRGEKEEPPTRSYDLPREWERRRDGKKRVKREICTKYCKSGIWGGVQRIRKGGELTEDKDKGAKEQTAARVTSRHDLTSRGRGKKKSVPKGSKVA